MKVICAGTVKTGTKSMREALQILGYNNVHDVFEQVVYDYEILNKALLEKSATEKDFVKAYSDVDAVTDLPGFLIWQDLMMSFPDAKVVLTVRDNPEAWLKSFKNMTNIERRDVFWFRYYNILKPLFCNSLCPSVVKYTRLREVSMEKIANCKANWDNLSLDDAKERYIQHNNNVTTNCPKERLLIFNVKEGWEPLCKFLGKSVPEVSFPVKNKNHSIAQESLNQNMDYDAGMTQTMPKEIIRASVIYLTVFAVFLFKLLN